MELLVEEFFGTEKFLNIQADIRNDTYRHRISPSVTSAIDLVIFELNFSTNLKDILNDFTW